LFFFTFCFASNLPPLLKDDSACSMMLMMFIASVETNFHLLTDRQTNK
jgi:hypothetical protein